MKPFIDAQIDRVGWALGDVIVWALRDPLRCTMIVAFFCYGIPLIVIAMVLAVFCAAVMT